MIASETGAEGRAANLIRDVPFLVRNRCISRNSDRSGNRRRYLVASSLASAVGLAAAAVFAGSPVLSLTGLAVALSGAFGGLAVLWSIPGVILTGVGAGAAIALMATVGNLSGYASPMLIGWISNRTGHVENGLLALGVITCLLSFCALRIQDRPASHPSDNDSRSLFPKL